MKPVKTMQRYQCDFCKKRSVKHIMEKHEKRCFRNPNRFCDFCGNKGHTVEEHDVGLIEKVDCHYCSSFDKKMLKEIEERESKEESK